MVDRATVEVCIPLDGPEQHWDWLLAHAHRGLYNALDEQAQEKFRERVLQSLRTETPSGGTPAIDERRLLSDGELSQSLASARRGVSARGAAPNVAPNSLLGSRIAGSRRSA